MFQIFAVFDMSCIPRCPYTHLNCQVSLQTPPTSAATYLTRVDSITVLGVTFNSKPFWPACFKYYW